MHVCVCGRTYVRTYICMYVSIYVFMNIKCVPKCMQIMIKGTGGTANERD